MDNAERNLYGSAILAAHFSMRQYKDVPVIYPSTDSDHFNKAISFKSSGIPFIIKDHEDWASFADDWVVNVPMDGYKDALKYQPRSSSHISRKNQIKSNLNCRHFNHDDEVDSKWVINVRKMIHDVGDEVVPVVSPDYDPEEPIKQHMTIKK